MKCKDCPRFCENKPIGGFLPSYAQGHGACKPKDDKEKWLAHRNGNAECSRPDPFGTITGMEVSG